MEDTMEKIGKILSDEESMRQLSELAQILMNENKTSECVPETNNCNNENNNFPDMSKIMQISEVMGNFSQRDRNTELLLALKPHLKEERQLKVDKAVKMLKFMTVYSVAKESGLLNDIL